METGILGQSQLMESIITDTKEEDTTSTADEGGTRSQTTPKGQANRNTEMSGDRGTVT